MKIITLILLHFFILLNSLEAKTQAVYGEDNRVEPYETSAEIQEMVKSTAAMVNRSKIVVRGFFSKKYHLNYKHTLGDRGICEGEKFYDQQEAAKCTGFFIGGKTLVTAGHCVQDWDDCQNNWWLFDYQVTRDTKIIKMLKKNSIYKCKKIIARKVDRDSKLDYAIIELDRHVTNRTALKLSDRTILGKESLTMIGHPSGLPSKVTSNARVLENSHPSYFKTDLDAFGGNSGSPVINERTGEVEGILVRGVIDYIEVERDGKKCRVVNRCDEINKECKGESVTRISFIQKYL